MAKLLKADGYFRGRTWMLFYWVFGIIIMPWALAEVQGLLDRAQTVS